MSNPTSTASTPKPVAVDVQPGGIPDAMKSRRQWVLWRYDLDKDAKWCKVPYQTNGRKKASCTDPATWATFDEAFAVYERGGWAGLMYALSGETDDFVFVDLDHVRDCGTGDVGEWRPEQRHPKRWADDAPHPQAIVDTLATYTEISPSETGLHLIVRGSLTLGGKAKDFETYREKRFACITGLRMSGTATGIAEVNGQLDEIAAKFLQIEKNDDDDAEADGGDGDDEPDEHTPDDDAALIEAARANDEKFGRLWAGDTTGYPSQSEADQALCNLLAFRCEGSRSRVDRLFRQSKLMRDKWDTRRGSSTYGRDTIRKAVKSAKAGEKKRPVTIRNYERVAAGKDENGKTKYINRPMMMAAAITHVQASTGDALKRVDNNLFVHDKQGKPKAGEVDWLAKPAGLFGFLASRARVDWRSGIGFVGREEFHAELCRTVQRYEAVEVLPHCPPMANHFYVCETPRPGDGATMREFIQRHSPETEIDGDLIQACLMTMLWGGEPGRRPAFPITSDSGRGSGKTTLALNIARPFGGVMAFSANEKIDKIKERLLTPEALRRRVCLLDNIKSLRFSWAELEDLLTNNVISGRQLYVGDGRRPNTIVWLVTLNGASLSTDMAQRSVIIKVKQPKRSGTWAEDTARFIDANREKLIADIVAAFQAERFQLARFTRWGSWEHDILSRLPEPEEAQRVILERQQIADVESEEADTIEEFFAEQLERLRYAADREQVHIPVDVAARWFNWATGESHKTTGASRMLRQMASEGKSKRIAPNASRANGRGFVWMGEHSDLEAAIKYDLLSRLAESRKKSATGEG